jgi:hypothetical protein
MPYPHAAPVVGDPVPTAIIEGLEQASCQVITFDPPDAGRSKRPAKLDLAEMLEGAEEALQHCAVNCLYVSATRGLSGPGKPRLGLAATPAESASLPKSALAAPHPRSSLSTPG